MLRTRISEKSWATFFCFSSPGHPVGVVEPSPVVKGSRKRRKSLKPKKARFFHTRPFEWFFFLQQSLRGKNWPPSINALSVFCCLTVETYRISKCFNCRGSDAISFKSQLCCLEQGSNLATARAQQAHACKARSFSFYEGPSKLCLKMRPLFPSAAFKLGTWNNFT